MNKYIVPTVSIVGIHPNYSVPEALSLVLSSFVCSKHLAGWPSWSNLSIELITCCDKLFGKGFKSMK